MIDSLTIGALIVYVFRPEMRKKIEFLTSPELYVKVLRRIHEVAIALPEGEAIFMNMRLCNYNGSVAKQIYHIMKEKLCK